MHILLMGILLGLGVAIPVGPINIEMMRRTLAFGFWSGFVIGIGATCVDIVYIVLLMMGALLFLTKVIVLKIISGLGALLLLWFGLKCFKSHTHHMVSKDLVAQSFFKAFCVGFLLNLLSPFPILFWVSISSQMISLSVGEAHGVVLAALGVIVGTMTWNFSMTMVLHKTRHLISEKVMRWFNISGGIILIAFAMVGFTRAFLI